VPRPIYLDREGVELVAHSLAAHLFAGHGSPLPAFQLMGDEGVATLESALGLPRHHYYHTIYDKAGVLLRSLIKNHPLVDGNKRVGMAATVVFLLLNHKMLIASNEDMVDYALRIAGGTPDLSWKEIASWLRHRTIVTKQSDEQLRAALSSLPDKWQKRKAVVNRLTDYIEAMETMQSELR